MKSMDCKMYYTVDSIIAKVARVIWVKNMWYIHQHILVKEKINRSKQNAGYSGQVLVTDFDQVQNSILSHQAVTNSRWNTHVNHRTIGLSHICCGALYRLYRNDKKPHTRRNPCPVRWFDVRPHKHSVSLIGRNAGYRFNTIDGLC